MSAMLVPCLLLGLAVLVALAIYQITSEIRIIRSIVSGLRRGCFVWSERDQLPRYGALQPDVDWLAIVPGHLYALLLLHLDIRFLRHRGFDVRRHFGAVADSLCRRSTEAGWPITLTQMIARDLFSIERRSIWNAIRECLAVLLLERQFSKLELLELYLCSVRFTFPLFGIFQMSRFLGFTCPGGDTVGESELLISLITGCRRTLAGIAERGVEAFNYQSSRERLTQLYHVLDSFPQIREFQNLKPEDRLQLLQASMQDCEQQELKGLCGKDHAKVELDVGEIRQLVESLKFRTLPRLSAQRVLNTAPLAFCRLLAGREAENPEGLVRVVDGAENRIIELARRHGVFSLLDLELCAGASFADLRKYVEVEREQVANHNLRAQHIADRLADLMKMEELPFRVAGDLCAMSYYERSGKPRKVETIDILVPHSKLLAVKDRIEQELRFKLVQRREAALDILSTTFAHVPVAMRIFSVCPRRYARNPTVLFEESFSSSDVGARLSRLAYLEQLVLLPSIWDWNTIKPLTDFLHVARHLSLEEQIDALPETYSALKDRFRFALYQLHLLFGYQASEKFIATQDAIYSRHKSTGRMWERFFAAKVTG